MSALRAMRLTLIGSMALFGLGVLLNRNSLGGLMMMFGTMAIAVSALGCVILRLVQLFGRRSHKPVEKPE